MRQVIIFSFFSIFFFDWLIFFDAISLSRLLIALTMFWIVVKMRRSVLKIDDVSALFICLGLVSCFLKVDNPFA